MREVREGGGRGGQRESREGTDFVRAEVEINLTWKENLILRSRYDKKLILSKFCQ